MKLSTAEGSENNVNVTFTHMKLSAALSIDSNVNVTFTHMKLSAASLLEKQRIAIYKSDQSLNVCDVSRALWC